MMRAIKFRAWDKEKKKMQPVKALSFDYCSVTGIKNSEIGVLYGEPYQDELSIEDAIHQGFQVANHHKSVDTCILMQFTGLTDKNGNDAEIYHHDIVEVTIAMPTGRYTHEGDDIYEDVTEIREVVYKDGAFGIRLEMWDCEFLPLFELYKEGFDCCSVVKIGNVHENKDLLNDSK